MGCGIFQLKKHSIIEVAEAMCNVVQKHKIVILLNLKVSQDRDPSQSHAHNPAQRDIRFRSTPLDPLGFNISQNGPTTRPSDFIATSHQK
jgi:hypothetical protein